MDSPTPNLEQNTSTRSVMSDVIIALIPAALYGCILFGLKAVLVLVVSIASAVAAELLWNLALRKKPTVGDLSAIVTGMLLGMSLSSATPLWIAAIGSVTAIIVVKQMFGGFGFNFANPAVTAKLVLLVSFASRMSVYYEPISGTDGAVPPFTESTGLSLKELFFGMHSGNIGETASFLLLIGGIYLALRRIISPVIPLSFIGTVTIFSLIGGQNLGVSLFGGSLMLCAVFMATDPTTTPKLPLGKLIFGVGCGIITFVIQKFCHSSQGALFAILIMNILTLHIDKIPPVKLPSLSFKRKEAQDQ